MSAIKDVTLRVYNVGFGDCMLLSIDYYREHPSATMLIDFGTTATPKDAPDSRMADIADHIKGLCRDGLDVVVATHRHADHISGFDGATGEVIADLHPRVVVQPWTEHPLLATDATTEFPVDDDGSRRGFARVLDNMASFARGARAEGARLADPQVFPEFPSSVAEGLQFLGKTNLTNRAAVMALKEMGAQARYVNAGDTLNDLLEGVEITVLGPPTLQQAPDIRRQTRTDSDEFWHLAGAWGRAAATGDARACELDLFDVMDDPPVAARWLVPRMHRALAGEMMGLLRSMDRVLNNTSLILLVRINDTTLLFAGDAQIENWSYVLFDETFPDRDAVLEKLSETNVYKVGHHGSLNATPKTLWKMFKNKNIHDNTERRLVTVMSTMAAKHGDSEKKTEVPRISLVQALRSESDLCTTMYTSKLCEEVRIIRDGAPESGADQPQRGGGGIAHGG